MGKDNIYGGLIRNRYPVRCRIYDGSGKERFDKGRFKREKTKDAYFQFKSNKMRIPAPDFQYLVVSDFGYVIYFKQNSTSEIFPITFDELNNKTPATINYGVASWLAEENKRATLRWRKPISGLMAYLPYIMLGVFFFIIVLGTLMYNNANTENLIKVSAPIVSTAAQTARAADNIAIAADRLSRILEAMGYNVSLVNAPPLMLQGG